MRPMKKTDKKERRQLIVEGAIACFIKNGVVGTTFKQIAKEAGVHQPLIGYYFPTFEDLFAAVIHVLLEDLKKLSVESVDRNSGDPKKALSAYLRAPMTWAKRRPQYNALWTFFYHLSSYQPQFRELNNSIRKVGRERISLLLYRFQESNRVHLKEGWTMQRLSICVHMQITGAMIHTVTETCDPDEMADLCEASVMGILASAFAEE